MTKADGQETPKEEQRVRTWEAMSGIDVCWVERDATGKRVGRGPTHRYAKGLLPELNDLQSALLRMGEEKEALRLEINELRDGRPMYVAWKEAEAALALAEQRADRMRWAAADYLTLTTAQQDSDQVLRLLRKGITSDVALQRLLDSLQPVEGS